MSCEAEPIGIDFTGVQMPIRLRRGDGFSNLTTLTLPTGITVTSASLVAYDADGNVETGLTGTADVSGSEVTWGFQDETQTAALYPGGGYTYLLRVTLSNGNVQSIFYGPLRVI